MARTNPKPRHKFSNGAFVFFRKKGVIPMEPEDVRNMAIAAGIDEAIVPEYAGDRMCMFRVLRTQVPRFVKLGWRLVPIVRTKQEYTYGISKEDKDEIKKRVKHEFESTFTWQAEPDPSFVAGDHPVAKEIDAEYKKGKGRWRRLDSSNR